MIMKIELNKPEPISSEVITELFKRGTAVQSAIEALEAGKFILVTEFYSNGLSLLQELHSHLEKKFPNTAFQEQREYRSEYRELLNLI